jgi:hypothetical protein
VKEVDTAKGPRNQREDGTSGPRNPELGVAADDREDVALAHLDEGKLNVVAVGKEVCLARQQKPRS